VDTKSESEHWYFEVKPERVPEDTARAAGAMRRFVMKDLGLDVLEIRWFLPQCEEIARMSKAIADLNNFYGGEKMEAKVFRSHMDISGETRSFTDGIVWVRANLRPQQAAKVVAHEARHLKDLQRYRPPLTELERENYEKSANKYEHWAWECLNKDILTGV
jgi:hypothetical protein